MEPKEIRRVDESHYEKRSVTGALITGLAAGTANAVATQSIGALKKPKNNKPEK